MVISTTITTEDSIFLCKNRGFLWQNRYLPLSFVNMKTQFGRFLGKIAVSISGLALIFAGSAYTPEEGMFPLNYLNITQLKNAGLQLDAEDIFNPGKISLTDALVNVGGCTGSFISNEGLIITNHHCVYGNVARLSTEKDNYLENGFVASDKTQELPVSMPCKITQSYEDVSDRVLSGTSETNTPSERISLIGKNIKSILEEERAKYPDLTIEISEMFIGKSYTLFRYIFLKDVRLVMAPPLTVGQFGGDTDNWEWPRHNGDFSLVRAYVGKDGKPAPYSKDNVPYQPKKILKINPNGTQENDFVFIMGYPGRTYRHESGSYLKFQQEIQLPTIQSFYKQYIDWMKELSDGNTAKRLKFAGTIQGMENVEKNYRGKMQGLRRTDVVQARQIQDAALKNEYKIGTPSGKQASKVVTRIQELWETRNQIGKAHFYSNIFTRQSRVIQLAELCMYTNALLQDKAIKNNQPFKDSIINDFQNRASRFYPFVDEELEKRAFIAVINGIQQFSAANPGINNKPSSQVLDVKTVASIRKSVVFDSEKMSDLIAKKPTKILSTINKDIVYKIVSDLSATRSNISEIWRATELELAALMPQYIGYREDYLQSQFIPDANSTLRLTYGYIKSYKPNDGEIHYPFTSLEGVFEKANTLPDYRLPKQVQDKLSQQNVPAVFKDPKTGKIVVGILYNMDTTGGNSGSPVLNSRGELIGLNFDRSFTATINDYAWNEDYSRSIGCDIRYVLYVLKYVSEADKIIDEMGIKL